ncbi:MAG: VPLPA-CTERM sorting domain-containing protein [Gammaproteobacteria bacterium]|nr:VPLPA-CTERM sorting domain-containing protein [Gammaproteobacteria bacterium]
MNRKLIATASLLTVSATLSGVSNAAPITLSLNGTLDTGSLSIHQDFINAPFSGTLEFDLSTRQIQSGNSNPFYELTSWSILVTGDNSNSLLLESSGEALDAGVLTLSTSSDIVQLEIDEDINTGGSTNLDRTLRLQFDPQLNITVDTTFEDLGNLLFLPPSSLLQFSTSQVPMTVASANLSVVPIPAAVWLFGSALAGLGWLRRKQASSR